MPASRNTLNITQLHTHTRSCETCRISFICLHWETSSTRCTWNPHPQIKDWNYQL